MKDQGFGDVFEQWERSSKRNKKKKNSRPTIDMESLIDLHPPSSEAMKEKEKGLKPKKDIETIRSGRITMAPQASLDLHGSTIEQATVLIELFLRSSKKKGLTKVLIIHGKGKHAADGSSPLRDAVRTYVQQSPLTGQTGIPPERLGGSGAIWVILR